jgi:hypothetical protein
MDPGAYASVSHAKSQVGIPKLESSVSINPLGGVDKLAMLGEQVSLRKIDRAAIPINFML